MCSYHFLNETSKPNVYENLSLENRGSMIWTFFLFLHFKCHVCDVRFSTGSLSWVVQGIALFVHSSTFKCNCQLCQSYFSVFNFLNNFRIFCHFVHHFAQFCLKVCSRSWIKCYQVWFVSVFKVRFCYNRIRF